MIVVEMPEGFEAERRYIIDVVLGEFLGLEYRAVFSARKGTRISMPGGAGELRLPDVFFAMPKSNWLRPESVPKPPFETLDVRLERLQLQLIEETVPVIFGDRDAGGAHVRRSAGAIELGLDVFGACFFLLTRYEEVPSAARDGHDRFPAAASVADGAGFLARPLADEYVEILWAVMVECWPSLVRGKREFRIAVTHDVDNPLCVHGRPLWEICRSLGADVILRRDPELLLRRLAAGAAAVAGRYDIDPCNTFGFLMQESERRGLASAFYFIAGHTAGRVDGTYRIDEPWIGELIRTIGARGHEIGLHPSYNTYRDAAALRREKDALATVMERFGVRQSAIGGRQHYLRWLNPATWQNWEEAGLAYDSTLAYAEQAGFRCGTCREYPAFNLATGRRLRLIERPLIVMDGTLLQYMALSAQAALEWVVRLCRYCRRMGGTFTLLWHNNMLIDKGSRRLYTDVLDACAQC